MTFSVSRMTIFVLACCAASPALAYVGPGPGLTMIGSLIGLVGSVFAALFMILAWPLRLFYKKKKAAQAAKAAQAPDSGSVPPTP